VASLPVLRASGLYTSGNPFSSLPEGALSRADNVVIRHSDTVEPRRGQNTTTATFGTTGDERAKEIFYYGSDSTLVVHYEDKLATYDGTTFTELTGSYTAPEPTLTRMKAVEASEDFYFTTSDGIYVLDSPTGTPTRAGVPLASNPSVFLATGTWLHTDKQVAYRVVWGRNDAHNVPRLGEPSGRAVVVNSSGVDKAVQLDIPIPIGIDASYFFRIYRSEMSADANTVPSDILFQVYENSPSAADVTSGHIIVTDITPEELFGGELYSNPTASGILQANTPPPLARDVALFGNRVWYANTQRPESMTIQLLAPPTTGDIFVIFGQAYEAGANAATDCWNINYPAGFTDSQKIQFAAQQLIWAINYRNRVGSTTSKYGTIRARDASGAEDLPGSIVIEALDYSVTTGYLGFVSDTGTTPVTAINPVPTAVAATVADRSRAGSTVTITTGVAHGFQVGDTIIMATNSFDEFGSDLYADWYDPDFLPGVKTVTAVPTSFKFQYTEAGAAVATAGGGYVVHKQVGVSSSNDRWPNRVYYSKLQQPEATPLVNFLDVGTKSDAILRIVPLRDRLYALKREGIYVISGEYPYRVDLLDNTTHTIASDSVAAVGNAIYALTDQGVVAVSDAGVRIVSRPIERTLTDYFGADLPNLRVNTFACGYESERSYLLWLGDADTADACSTAYVYNSLTQSWTRWPLTRTCAKVSPTEDRLFLGNPDDNTLWAERKTLTALDYADATYTPIITGVSAASITINNVSFTISAGDVLEQSGHYVIVLDVTVGVNTILSVSGDTSGFGTGASTLYKAIPCSVRWHPVSQPGGPAITKQFQEVSMHFDAARFRSCSFKYATELKPTEGTVAFESTAWGLTGLGGDGTVTALKNARRLVTKDQSEATSLVVGLDLTEANATWRLYGYTLTYEPMGSERNSR
jgi:hypothetical protein